MRTIAALALVAGLSTTATAQNSVSVAAGVTIPMAATADEVNSGYHAALALTAKPPLAAVGIRLEAMFNSFGMKANTDGSSTKRILSATANATLSNPSTPLRSFYLIGGLGVYNTRVVGGPSDENNNDVGFNVGLGMTLTSAVVTFVEARYHHVPSEASTTRMIPISFGLRF
jgi:hypothetical protein